MGCWKRDCVCIHIKATANLTLSGETEGFPLGCRTRCRDPLGLIRVHTKLDILLRVVRQENRRKGLQIKMKDENHFCLLTTWSCILKILKKSLKETQLKINRASEVGGGVAVSNVAGSLQGIRSRRQNLLPAQSYWSSLSTLWAAISVKWNSPDIQRLILPFCERFSSSSIISLCEKVEGLYSHILCVLWAVPAKPVCSQSVVISGKGIGLYKALFFKLLYSLSLSPSLSGFVFHLVS